MASHLNQPHFQNADKAREFLERERWPNGPICPHCGVIDQHYELKGKAHRVGLWKCKDCLKQFSVTVGTVFERSKIPLNIWLQAVFLLCSSKKGMSSHQLHRMLGVTYKTAWFMTHRIREAMTTDSGGLLGGGGGPVEVDETYWGTSAVGKRNKTVKRRIPGTIEKMKIVSLVERGGEVRSFTVARITKANIYPLLRQNIAPEAHLMTDEAQTYVTIGREFKKHSSVNHGEKEYVRGKAHVNTLESFFNIFKRGLIGTFHHVGEQHLQRYVKEFDFRYNNRTALGVTDEQRTKNALKAIAGKRLTYRRTLGEQTAPRFKPQAARAD